MIIEKFLVAGKKRAISDVRPDKVELYNTLQALGRQKDSALAYDDEDYKRLFKINNDKFIIVITDYINFKTGGFLCVS